MSEIVTAPTDEVVTHARVRVFDMGRLPKDAKAAEPPALAPPLVDALLASGQLRAVLSRAVHKAVEVRKKCCRFMSLTSVGGKAGWDWAGSQKWPLRAKTP